jgi:hypothetical protein
MFRMSTPSGDARSRRASASAASAASAASTRHGSCPVVGPGLHQVHAREEPRHLFTAAGRQRLLNHPFRDVPEAVSFFLAEEIRPQWDTTR